MFIDYPLAVILAVSVLLIAVGLAACILFAAEEYDRIEELKDKLCREKRWSDYLELKEKAERAYKMQFMNNLRETESTEPKEERKDA